MNRASRAIAPAGRLGRSVAAGLLSVIFVEWAMAAPVHAANAPPAASPPSASSPAPIRPLAETLTGQAKDDYESAKVLFETGDFTGALVKFQHAYELASDVRLLWDMAACEKSLRHYVRVLRLVERYLHDGVGRITDAQRADAEDVLRTVRALVSRVRIVVNEPGASVYVDDDRVGTSPLPEPVLVDLGDRRIRVTKPGFKEVTLPERVVGASDSTVTVALERELREGRLSVRASVTGTVRVDDVSVGETPWEGPVSPGQHLVRVVANGTAPYSSTIVVHEGEHRTLDVTLQPRSSGVSPAVWIAGGVLVAAGLAVGGYYLFRPSQSSTESVTNGTIVPGTIRLSQLGSWR